MEDLDFDFIARLPLVALPKDRNGKAEVMEDWTVDVAGWTVFVPKGFKTDGASIPRFLWRVCGHPYEAPRVFAAIVHDGLYGNEKWSPSGMTRAEADRVYRELLIKLGVSKTAAYVEYAALRLFGSSHWTKR